MIWHILTLAAGVLLAWYGGERFVGGAMGLAKWARWPASVIGATVAAFGTSSPELMVGISAASGGRPEISFGDVLGSNVANVALVLAVALLISPIKAERNVVRRDLVGCIFLPVLVALISWDGRVSRPEAGVLLVVFVDWLLTVLRGALIYSRALSALEHEPGLLKKGSISSVVGLILLLVAAQLVVKGGQGIALALGWSPFVVGAVVVAVATSTPELATTLVAKIRGHDEVSLGNILGSNIFNACFIAAIVGLICPFQVAHREILPSLVFGLISMLLIIPGADGMIGRQRGIALLFVYVAFVWLSLRNAHAVDL